MGPKSEISQIGKIPGYFAGVYLAPGKPRVYLENTRVVFAGFLGFASDFAPNQLSDSGKLESCQNGAGMEHQTPSGAPGNFRKLKVLGTLWLCSLWFPSGLPETLVKAKLAGPARPARLSVSSVAVSVWPTCAPSRASKCHQSSANQVSHTDTVCRTARYAPCS